MSENSHINKEVEQVEQIEEGLSKLSKALWTVATIAFVLLFIAAIATIIHFASKLDRTIGLLKPVEFVFMDNNGTTYAFHSESNAIEVTDPLQFNDITKNVKETERENSRVMLNTPDNVEISDENYNKVEIIGDKAYYFTIISDSEIAVHRFISNKIEFKQLDKLEVTKQSDGTYSGLNNIAYYAVKDNYDSFEDDLNSWLKENKTLELNKTHFLLNKVYVLVNNTETLMLDIYEYITDTGDFEFKCLIEADYIKELHKVYYKEENK